MEWWITATFVILVAIGVPIPFVLGLTTLGFFLLEGFLPLAMIPQRMFTAIDSFTMVAIPLFMLVGALMNAGGISHRLIRFSRALVGHITGGLAHVNVVTSMFFSGVSGAAAADASAVGSILIPAMRRSGYSPEFSAAVTAGSSLIGPIVPPSIPMILYGVIAGTSISALFLAGAVPGILLGLSMMAVAWWISRRAGYRGEERASGRELFASFKATLPAATIPVIILGGILGGVFTPTEASAVGVLAAFIVGALVYRELKWRHLPQVLITAGISTGVVMLVIAFSQGLAFVLASQQIPQMVIQGLTAISESPWVILLLINLLLLIIGALLEPAPALVIVVPVLLPLTVQLGIDPVHFGVIVVLNLVIGLVTPPVGAALFVVTSIGRLDLAKVGRAMWPFIAAAVVVLLIVTYVPGLSMWLPGLLR